MPQCPQCQKSLVELTRNCPSCKADLDLLVDYVSHLQGGLERAENLTRAGELGQAVWAYLEVLEVDPDNAAARRQAGQVATAVRQFDSTAPGRRWINRLRLFFDPEESRIVLAVRILLIGVLMFFAFALGYGLGDSSPPDKTDPVPPPPAIEKKKSASMTGD